jgi:hypothetical protein
MIFWVIRWASSLRVASVCGFDLHGRHGWVASLRVSTVLTVLTPWQPSVEEHRRCRRSGLGCGAATQHDAEVAVVRLGCGCGCYLRPRWCGCVAAAVAEREPHHLGQCSHLHMGSLDDNNIGDAGARALGAALRVNTTLMTLM